MLSDNISKIKTLVIYGDSISTTEYGNGGYEPYLKEKLKIETVYNHSISSSGLSSETPDSLAKRFNHEAIIHNNADVVIIWYGTNDWYWGASIDTFRTELELVIQKLQHDCPNAYIIYLTPLFRYQAPDVCDTVQEAYINPNRRGHTLKEYYDCIIETSQKLCFSVVDMRTQTNIHLYNCDTYLPDFVHPSAKGYQRVASILCNYLNSLFIYE